LSPPDPDLQRMLGELARGDKTAGKTPDGVAKKLPLREIAAGALFAAMGMLIALYWIKLWRRLSPSWAGASSIHRVAYRAALDVLVESGARRDLGETRESFASRLAPSVPALVPLTRAHVGRAFGAKRLPSVADMRAMAQQAQRQAATRAPWWRRLLGLLDPTSWLRAR
jgi:hypothetical protein